jgi:Spy/CpxP family protein refolding chaperone
MGGPERGGQVLAMLDLSDEQKGEIKELRTEQRGKMKEMRQKHQKSIEKVLSKEQREKLEELKDEVFYGRGW